MLLSDIRIKVSGPESLSEEEILSIRDLVGSISFGDVVFSVFAAHLPWELYIQAEIELEIY